MSISYDYIVDAFLNKISEFDLAELAEDCREDVVKGYMKRAITHFGKNCKYDLISTQDDVMRKIDADIDDDDIDELVEIISEGMVVQWLKPYVYKQENLENAMSTRDYSMYSPAELLMRVGNAYKQANRDYTQMIREYSYNHGDLTDLHI